MKYIKAHNPCSLCGSTKVELYQTAGEGFLVVRCSECRLIYVDPQPDEEILKAAYDFNYYEPWLFSQKELKNQMWQKRLNRIRRIIPSGRLLDIGCGDGGFLELAEVAGYDVTGTEYSEVAANITKSRLKHGNVFVGPLRELSLTNNYFDIVTIWHVLEHDRDPAATVKRVKLLLRSGGWLVIAVPNAENYLERFIYFIVKGQLLKIFSIHNRELHLYHFTRQTLTLLVENAGFKVENFFPDMGTIDRRVKLVNQISRLIYYIMGRFWGGAIQVEAKKYG